METSVVICVYERLDFLAVCLDSLRNAADQIHEVVIADDGSSEPVVSGLKSMIPKYQFPIIHAWLPRNGPRRSATRNNGIRRASGSYIIFLDADFAVLPGAVQAHIAVAKPGFFAAGRCKYTTEEQCRRIISEGASETLLESIYAELPEEHILKEHSRFCRQVLLRKFHLTSARRVSFGGHFSAFKEDIEMVNGYDENFVGWGGEDLDFATRMVKAGISGTSVIRTARILHLWHQREMGDKHWKEGGNMAYYLRKHVPTYCEDGLAQPGPLHRKESVLT